MNSFLGKALMVVLVAWLAAPLSAVGQTQPREPHTFLMKHIGFKPADISEMEQGKVVTKVLKTNEKTEVAVFGIVWIDAPMDWFVRWQKDIETLESGDAVQAIKKISDPPQLSDFDELTFPEDDLKAIPKCKVGDCEVKADAPALERLQKEVNWSAPDAHEQASRLIRQMTLEAAQEYRKNGDAALGAYRDKKRPTFLDKEFEGLLKNSPFLVEYIPEFHRYLDEYPNAELAGADSYLYWSRVQFGLRPTVRMNHVVIYPFGEGDDAAVAIGSKMLYASHYFHTALEMKFLVKDSANPKKEGFYLISLNRSRSDGLTGFFGGIVRSAAQGEARKGLAFALESGKQVLEEAYRKRTSP
jgi:hypothetical protein